MTIKELFTFAHYVEAIANAQANGSRESELAFGRKAMDWYDFHTGGAYDAEGHDSVDESFAETVSYHEGEISERTFLSSIDKHARRILNKVVLYLQNANDNTPKCAVRYMRMCADRAESLLEEYKNHPITTAKIRQQANKVVAVCNDDNAHERVTEEIPENRKSLFAKDPKHTVKRTDFSEVIEKVSGDNGFLSTKLPDKSRQDIKVMQSLFASMLIEGVQDTAHKIRDRLVISDTAGFCLFIKAIDAQACSKGKSKKGSELWSKLSDWVIQKNGNKYKALKQCAKQAESKTQNNPWRDTANTVVEILFGKG